jgi:Protein of unknown function (DUF4038)
MRKRARKVLARSFTDWINHRKGYGKGNIVVFEAIDRRSFLAGFAAVVSDKPRYLARHEWLKLVALGDQGASLPPLRFPVALNSSRTAFLDQYGMPCFACGDSPQYLIQQLSKPDVKAYLFDRAVRGINVLWMIAADKIYQSNPPYNLAGNAPFSGADFANFNEPHWAHVDYVMQRCLAYGMTVLLMPLFVGLSGQQGYLTILKASSNAVMRRYETFLANRYKGFPNLIWLLGADADPNDSAATPSLTSLPWPSRPLIPFI